MSTPRTMCAALLGVMVLSACESRAEQPNSSQHIDTARPTPPADAMVDAAFVFSDPGMIERLRALPPPYKPAPPLRKRHKHGDCRPAYAPHPERDPNPMCKIDGGTFAFGEDGTSTTVGTYLIDQFEVSAAQAALFLNARGNNICVGIDRRVGGGSGPNSCVGIALPSSPIVAQTGRYEVRAGYERTAVGTFSWQGVLEYCAWVGKHVPSSAHWEFAARHDPRTGKDLAFAWGDRWLPDRASCWYAPGCGTPPQPAHGVAWIGLFDGTKGRGDGSSPWGLDDVVGGAGELVFACPDPEATCIAGEPCTCSPQTTPGDAATTDGLQLTRRLTGHRVGYQGARCAALLPSPASRPAR